MGLLQYVKDMIDKLTSNKIYCATFILAVLVISIHSSYMDCLNPLVNGYDFSFTIHRTIIAIADSAVPTFFAISGYLLFSKFTLKEYPKTLLKKVFTLVIPYLMWSVIGFLSIKIFYPLIINSPIEVTFESVVLDILFSRHCPQIWFIRPLLVYIICSPILYFIFKYLKKWSIFIPITIFVIYIFFRPDYYGIAFWIPLFFVGSYLAYFKAPIQNHFKPILIGLSSIVMLLTISFLLAYFKVDYSDYPYFIYRFISPILFWLSIDIIYRLFLKEQVRDIFKISPFLFFTHYYIVYGIKQLLELGISPTSNYRSTLLFVLVWLLSSIITISLGYLLKRYVNPLYRVMTGRK